MPKVINIHRQPQGNAVYIGRPSRWGNPFVIGRDGTRDEVIAKFEGYLKNNADLFAQCMTDLRGKDLACFCAPKKCHGDVLLAIANPGTGRKSRGPNVQTIVPRTPEVKAMRKAITKGTK